MAQRTLHGEGADDAYGPNEDARWLAVEGLRDVGFRFYPNNYIPTDPASRINPLAPYVGIEAVTGAMREGIQYFEYLN